MLVILYSKMVDVIMVDTSEHIFNSMIECLLNNESLASVTNQI